MGPRRRALTSWSAAIGAVAGMMLVGTVWLACERDPRPPFTSSLAPPDTAPRPSPLPTPPAPEQVAARRAEELLGFSGAGPLVAERVTLGECPIPFIGAAYDGAEVWRVEVPGVRLAPVTEFGERINPHISGLAAFFTDEGQMLWAESIPAPGVAPDVTRDARGDVELTLSHSHTFYQGLPERPPELSVAEFLRRALNRGWGPWASAAEIRIMRLRYMKERVVMKNGPQDVWVATFRGLAPGSSKCRGYRPCVERLIYHESGKLVSAQQSLR